MLWDYSQPEFYRFNEDSIWLAEEAAKLLTNEKMKILDMFAGCGVVSLEIDQRSSLNHEYDLIEIQHEFIPSIENNISQLKTESIFNIFNLDFRNFNERGKYNLIASNPPYFSLSDTRPPENTNRLLCRHRRGFDWSDIFKFVDEYLETHGLFIFLSRDDLSDMKFDNGNKIKTLGKKTQTWLFLYS